NQAQAAERIPVPMPGENTETQEKRETRKRLIEWAKEFDLGQGDDAEKWIEESFKFLPSGEAVCKGDLWLPHDVNRMPKGIVRVAGNLFNRELTSAQGFELPEVIGVSLWLDGLTLAQGLKLPQVIGHHLILDGLTSIQGLELPQKVGGNVYLSNVTDEEIQQLRNKYPNLCINPKREGCFDIGVPR
ncbi:MAG: hypothetical protein WCW31_05215, partial [Patescibacteria group bacterium]